MKWKSTSAPILLAVLCSCEQSENPSAWSPEAGAEFRLLVTEIIARLDPECPLTAQPNLLEKYTPLKERFAAITDRAEGSKFGVDIAIAQADEDYRRTTYVLECPDLDEPGGFHETMDSYLDSHLADTGKMLDSLENMMRKDDQ